MKSFSKLPTTQKGKVGEEIAFRYLEATGAKVYRHGKGSYPLDSLIIQDGQVYGVEVKTYARRYVNETTGIDGKDFDCYSSLYKRCRLRVVVLFVDPFEQCIYGGRVDQFAKYAKRTKGKVYFPLSCFQVLCRLTPDELAKLQEFHAGSGSDPRYYTVWPYYSQAETAAQPLAKRWEVIRG